MSVTVKDGYPNKLTNQEIIEEMDKLRLYANGGGWRWDMIASANLMIQTGNTELNERFSRKNFYIMLWLTILSLIAAIGSIWFAIQTDRTDTEWRNSEIEILNKIENHTSKLK
jgi:hypothetical protein